ncbi:MAG TPA: response regulator transcription factor [Bacillota bacterium]|nr:response regulator transcription factor [Bacillota bacterium]HOA15168.1 response regulator transcription factor [Bacillota bacterium]HOG52245.1 response regulator transcription factor [Bacillota bacterium]
MGMAKILIADDERRIRDLVQDSLESQGYEVLAAADGAEALDIFSEDGDIALVILDVMMPHYDGWTVCREIRKKSQVPILMLTARGEEFDELHGFEVGADDYLAKPFSLALLLARVAALLRRIAPPKAGQVKVGKLEIDPAAHEVRFDGRPVELAPKEFEALLMMASNLGKVFSRRQLLTSVWGYSYIGDERTVDTHMARLRQKLGDEGGKMVKTVRGFGYKLEAGL